MSVRGRALGDWATAAARRCAGRVDRNVESYDSFAGPDLVGMIRNTVLRSPDAITERLAALEDVGVEEVCLWPQARGLDQLHGLANTGGL